MRRRPYPSTMRIFTLDREQLLPGRPDEVFAFFADARNLEAITPPLLRFEVVTPGEIPMRVGTLIQYRLTLRGIGVNWLTSIQEWDPPHRFVDVKATIMRDTVRYAIGFGPLGALAARAFVHKDVATIFDFRRDAVLAALGRAADGLEPVEDEVHAGKVPG